MHGTAPETKGWCGGLAAGAARCLRNAGTMIRAEA